MIKLLPHISSTAGAPAGALVLKPGLCDLDEGTAAAFGLLAVIGKPHGRVGTNGEGAACSLPVVVPAPGLGAGARHPEVEAVTVVMLGARAFRVGPQGWIAMSLSMADSTETLAGEGASAVQQAR